MTDQTRRKNEPGGRHIRHVVKLSESEEKLLQGRANAVSVTVARFLAEAALGTVPQVKNKVAVTELFAIRRQLQGEANNLNQLVRDAHAGDVFTTDLHEAIAACTALNARLDAWLEANS